MFKLRKCIAAVSPETTDGLTVAASALLVLSVLVVLLPGVPFWLDAPEFIAAAWSLGQVHPPGHPVAMVLFKGFLLLPIGPAAFRANLASATFGALSAAAVGLLTLSFAGVLTKNRSRVRLMGVAATVGYGLCASSMLQSLSVEVYTMNAALVFWALVLAARYPGDARVGGVIGVLVGLGLANHHFLTLLALPGIVALFTQGVGLRIALRRAIPGAVAAIAVTVGAYLYLPARSGGWPAWADASPLGGTLWIASARVFAGSLGGFESPIAGLAGNVALAVGMLVDTLTWPGLLLALLGIGVALFGGRRWLAAGLVLWIAGSLASKVAMGLLDPDNPDDHGYFLAAFGGLVVAQGMAVVWLADRSAAVILPALLAPLLALVIALLPLPAGLATARDRAVFDESGRVADLFWQGIPPRAVALVSHYPVLFGTMHYQIF